MQAGAYHDWTHVGWDLAKWNPGRQHALGASHKHSVHVHPRELPDSHRSQPFEARGDDLLALPQDPLLSHL